MWNVKLISGFVAAASIVVAQSVGAVRSQDYTAAQFISVLNGLGYGVPLNASIADPRVQQAIRDFQVLYRLPVDGTLNLPTQDRAADIVRTLQAELNRAVKPSPQLPASQFYGRQTENAVRQFQQQNGLPVTGLVTLETRQRLTDVLNDATPRTEPTVSPNTPQPIAVVRPVPLSIYTESQVKSILIGLGYDIDPRAALSNGAIVRSVRELQRLYGLSETGVVDRATEEKLSNVIRNLRNNLKTVLRGNFAVAQYYDPATQAAVREFQSRYGLRVTGIANLEVRSRIDSEARRLTRG